MLSIIVAVANNNVIGKDNKLLWRLSNDLKRFKAITSGNTIIMGRKTFQSLPGMLPDRQHIILTKDENFNAPGAVVINSIEKLLLSLDNSREYFIIGGGEIYKALFQYADKIYLTSVDKDFEGDTFFPEIDYSKWNIVSKEAGIVDEKNSIKHTFINLERIK